ncbi:MAG TPA: acetate kinase, partial [Porphyromonadaceae bacterium]|nr:acetate kinase [Porphyromonadaceae bacterium]
GTSHRYVSERAAQIANIDYGNCKIISCHIGNGASITAVKNGKSVDTSMGLTPLEGLIMGTRCGDIDAGAITFIMEKEGLDAKGISDLLNKKGGVLGLSGVSSDMREIDEAIEKGNSRAKMALDAYIYKIKKYIGSYVAVLGGVDILLFTGGVGENQYALREEVCKGLECMGIVVDHELNHGKRGEEIIISPENSKVVVMVVPTNEEYMIAYDTIMLLS